MSVKFPFFGGVLGGGGSADFIFMGARIFLRHQNRTLLIFPEPQNAWSRRISGTLAGKPGGNLGPTLA